MKKRPPDSPGQMPLEANQHINRKLILRKAKLPTVTVFEGKELRKRLVKPYHLIGVLKVIVDHGQGCWLRMNTIADESRFPRNVVIRAIAALFQESLICIVKHPRAMGGVSHQYTINWSELALLCKPSAVPRGDLARSPGEAGAVPRGDSSCPQGEPPRNRDTSFNESRCPDELKFPDFKAVDLADPWGVSDAIELLDGFGFDPHTIALAAAIASRSGNKPHALFVSLLRNGWGRYPPAEQDHETAKETLRVIGGWARELVEAE